MSKSKISLFKIKNRAGFAAVCDHHLTEGKSKDEAMARMMKALKRTAGKAKKK